MRASDWSKKFGRKRVLANQIAEFNVLFTFCSTLHIFCVGYIEKDMAFLFKLNFRHFWWEKKKIRKKGKVS